MLSAGQRCSERRRAGGRSGDGITARWSAAEGPDAREVRPPLWRRSLFDDVPQHQGSGPICFCL